MPFDDSDKSIFIDSRYYDTETLNKTEDLKNHKLGVLHLNIASLSKHIEDLHHLISSLDFTFQIIALTEHKIGKNTPIVNINLPGYQFSYTPSIHMQEQLFMFLTI